MNRSSYEVPKDINYIAVFLTFACQLRCSYCINRIGELSNTATLPYQTWVAGLSRFITRPDLPLTLQGGEPTCYKGFYDLVAKLPITLPLDLLTNGQFDVEEFVARVKPLKFGRIAKYAPIRFSYHAETMDAVDTVDRMLQLQKLGFKVGVWAVDAPIAKAKNTEMMNMCQAVGIDFRWKEYLSKSSGTYKYPDSIGKKKLRNCMCRTNEILISPSGYFHRCHADLYAGRNPIGHILDKKFPDFQKQRPCSFYGACNFCDVKQKFNRFQEPGNCSVTITEIE